MSRRSSSELELFFVAHVLGKVQGWLPPVGRIITSGGTMRKVSLEAVPRKLAPYLETIQEWESQEITERPPLILNKHCSLCQFRSSCREKAEQEDNLSLLERMTPKAIRQYEKKGIFTVKQLSYLFKPRKRKKQARNLPPVTHNLELQALAIRTGKIYIQEQPFLARQEIELYLDIESIPDQDLHYLVGLLVCQKDTATYHAFWVDHAEEEGTVWNDFLALSGEYPGAPIYHYGSYETRVLKQLTRRYGTDSESLVDRLINVNKQIFGKVYFPVYSNRLQEIASFVGARWTSPDASGLQSLVWRHHWDDTHQDQYKSILLTYNEEDCRALKLLVDKLPIRHSANTLSEVEFADQYKQQTTTEVGEQVHTVQADSKVCIL